MMSEDVTMSHVSYSMMSRRVIWSREQSRTEHTRMKKKGEGIDGIRK